MKKITYYIVFVIFGMLIIFSFPSNTQLKLNEDSTTVLGNLQPIEQFQRLFNLKWKDELSPADIVFVQKGLATEYDFVADEAMEVIAVHNLVSLASGLVNPDRKHIVNQEFAEILQSGLSKNKISTGNYLLQRMEEEKSHNHEEDHSHGRKSTSELIESILITNKCKALRKGKSYKVDVGGISESGLNKILLEYSEQSREEVITSIISGFKNAPNTDKGQTNKKEVLRTYGYEPIKQVVDLISDRNAQTDITPSGRFLMFRLLTDQFVLLTEEDKSKLKEVLNSPLISNGYFSEPTSLMVLARLMRERLSPENYTAPAPTVVEPQEPLNQKELDSIQKSIDSEPRKATFSRPEDRGESFKEFSKADVLEKLVSNDKIEQRKAAIELGNRYIAGQLELTKQEQEMINAKTQEYIEMSTSNDVHMREEGKLQIHRLWQLSIPVLLDNLHNENVTKLELAAKSLILMRNEAAVEGLIEKMNTAPNDKNKKMLLFVMSKMEEQRKTVVPNRTCMNEGDSKALFNRLLASEIAKHKDDNNKK